MTVKGRPAHRRTKSLSAISLPLENIMFDRPRP